MLILGLFACRSLNHAMLLPVGLTLVNGVLAMWSVVALVLKLVPSLASSLKMVGSHAPVTTLSRDV